MPKDAASRNQAEDTAAADDSHSPIVAIRTLADAGVIGVFGGLEVYTTVFVYGAGVDYSLFLISRYREELLPGFPPVAALSAGIVGVGVAITATAGTEMFGIGTLALARFGKFQQAGITIAAGLLIMLSASLTLTPALLRIVGRPAFWPRHTDNNQSEGRAPLFERFAGSVQAIETLEQYFAPGITGPVTVLVQDEDAGFDRETGIDRIERGVQQLKQRRDRLGIADVRSVASPLGITPRGQESLPEGQTSLVERLIRERAVDECVSDSEPHRTVGTFASFRFRRSSCSCRSQGQPPRPNGRPAGKPDGLFIAVVDLND